jgi:hypothetical protein
MTKFITILAFALPVSLSPMAGHSFEIENMDLTVGTNRIIGTDVFNNSKVALDNKQITFDMSGRFTDRIGFELGGGKAKPSESFRGASDVRRLSAALTYDISDQFELGVYSDWSGFTWLSDYDTQSYGLQARYATDIWQISGYLGKSDYKKLGVPDKADNFGLNLHYTISDRFGLGGYYDYEQLSLVKLQRYGLAVDWRLTNRGQQPVILRASAGKHKIDSKAVNNFALTLHIPLKGKGRFDRSRFHPHSGFHDGYAITGLHSGPTAPTFCTLYPERCR